MGIKLGLVGLGVFGKAFAPLFLAHPQVSAVALCDAEPERMAEIFRKYEKSGKIRSRDLFESFDDICKSDCDALVIITQPWLHAPQCIQAMEHGKSVYSAVPVISLPDDDEMLDWCGKIIETVQRTGLQYMLGETTTYRPQTMLCRRMAAAGRFGHFVYAEAEYAHDVDNFTCSLREVQRRRTQGKIGQLLKAQAQPYRDRGFKSHPMSYPTHSMSGVIDVMRTKPVKVSAYGFRDPYHDPFFEYYDFTNITALFQLENGAAFRVSELREISPNTGLKDEDFRIFGTRGSYSCGQFADNGRTGFSPEPKKNEITQYTDEEMRDKLPEEVALAYAAILGQDVKKGDDFVPAGHGGSHPYLVHEFVSCLVEQRTPQVSAWDAAMYMAMGVAAHKSAQRDGELVQVPDFGKVWR